MKSILTLFLTAALATGQTTLVNGKGGGITDQSAFLTALGGSTAGKALFQLSNPSAITFPRINADNTASALSASSFRTALGLGSLATQSGTFSGTTSGTNTGDQTTISGNAGSATVLQTARTINGVSFNGSANITVPAAGSTLTDTVPVSKGGTGATSLTAYAPIFAGTTSTAAVQSGTVGTAGQVLTSNGAGSIPTFQAATTTSLSYAVNALAATRRLKSTLDSGLQSASVLVIGDSMSDDSGSSTTTGDWPSQIAYRMAAAYPAYNVVRRSFNTGTSPKRYDDTTIQTGPSGVSRLELDSNNQYGWAPPTLLTPASTDLDIRIQVNVTSWAAQSSRACLVEEATNRFWFWTNSSKSLVLDWFGPSSAFNRASSTAAFSTADGATTWFRVTMQGNVSGHNNTKFYTSSDGVTWTQLGSTVVDPWNVSAQPSTTVAGAVSVGGGIGLGDPLVGANIYKVEVRDGLDGPVRNARALTDWSQTWPSARNRVTGSPTLTITNASSYGFSINSWLTLDSSTFLWAHNDGPGCVIVAQGYNNTGAPATTLAAMDSLRTAVRLRRPFDPWLVVVQPFCSVDTVGRWSSNMRNRGGFYDWAVENKAGVIDIHTVFRAASGSDSSLTYFVNNPGGSDVGIHPNSSGQILWADSFMTVFNQ